VLADVFGWVIISHMAEQTDRGADPDKGEADLMRPYDDMTDFLDYIDQSAAGTLVCRLGEIEVERTLKRWEVDHPQTTNQWLAAIFEKLALTQAELEAPGKQVQVGLKVVDTAAQTKQQQAAAWRALNIFDQAVFDAADHPAEQTSSQGNRIYHRSEYRAVSRHVEIKEIYEYHPETGVSAVTISFRDMRVAAWY
jgi:hypothetical protein